MAVCMPVWQGMLVWVSDASLPCAALACVGNTPPCCGARGASYIMRIGGVFCLASASPQCGLGSGIKATPRSMTVVHASLSGALDKTISSGTCKQSARE